MYTLIVILILIVSLCLAGVVLVQNSKGGGLAANFGGANQVMGVRRTTETIEKITWYLVIALVVLSLCATIAIPRQHGEAAMTTEVSTEAAKSLTPVANVPTATEATTEAPAQAE